MAASQSSIFSLIFALFVSAMPWIIAFFVGSLSASAELFSRYKEPRHVIKFWQSYLYVALNGSAAILALIIANELGIKFGPLSKSPIMHSALCGLSVMAILRSSVASIKYGSKSIEAGFAPILHSLLNAVDKTFDRKRSQYDVTEIRDIMRNVNFNKAVKDLPTTCLSLMENANSDETQKMGEDINDLQRGTLQSQATKALILGVIISKVTGTYLLRSAVESLRHIICDEQKGATLRTQTQQTSSQIDQIKEMKKRFAPAK